MDYTGFLESKIPELADLEQFIKKDCVGQLETFANIPLPDKKQFSKYRVRNLPLYKFTYGSQHPGDPVLVVVGGVHGLERIGAQVVKALLFSFNELVQWDSQIQQTLKTIRVIFIPIVNPWGMALNQRSNANGVDLMRNAPVDASGDTFPFLSGHRLGAHLPWFRGYNEDPMELEAQALSTEISREKAMTPAMISLDIHSGFGFKDQLWFPYAKTKEPFGHLAEMMAIKNLLDRTLPYHVYKVEPQALNYVTHGDLWDHLYDEHQASKESIYLPLCLEMGSWTWVKKNPSQLFKTQGIFDPILPHRRQRAYRRHFLLFDFLIRAVLNHGHWSRLTSASRKRLQRQAEELWYP